MLGVALGGRAAGDAVVLGIARGGVIVGRAVADVLGAPLDVVIPRKIGAPRNPELGLGAIAPGIRVLDERLLEVLHVSEEYLEGEIAAEEAEIERRTRAYRGDRPPIPLDGRTAVVVDDGIATGGTAVAAIRWARARGAVKVVLAVPVAPGEAVARMANEADEVIVIETPPVFQAVGQWYRDFGQTTDTEVVAALGVGDGESG
ncbi:MAG: phosphoribosyltransferase family protein [Actinomycetota bacterium]